MAKNIWRALSICICILMIVAGVFAIGNINICPMIDTQAGGQVPMKCHWTFVAVSWISVIGIATSLVSIISNTKDARRNISVISVVVYIVMIALLTPAGIGVCAHDGSACHGPAIAIGIAAGLAAIISIVMYFKCDPEIASRPIRTL